MKHTLRLLEGTRHHSAIYLKGVYRMKIQEHKLYNKLDYVLNNKIDMVIMLLICYIVFQNFLAILFSKIMYGSLVIIGIKDIAIYLLLGLLLLLNYKKITLVKSDFLAIIYYLILIVYLMIPENVSWGSKIVQFRQLSTPVTLYLLGRLLFLNRPKFNNLLKFIVNISIFSVSFGIIERFILKDDLWIKLGIMDYMAQKGMDRWSYGKGGLPGNFYTYDWVQITDEPVRRMVSFIADPTLFGQFLVFPIAILLITKIYIGKKRYISLLILLIGLLSTLSKGGILSVFIIVIFVLLNSKFKKVGLSLLTVLVLFVGILLFNAEKFSSLPAHLNGLFQNIKLLIEYPFGMGLGQSGNLAKLYSSKVTGSGESYFGMMIGQIGIFSIVMIAFFWFAYFRFNSFDNNHNKLFQSLTISLFISSLLSESAVSFISAGLVFIFMGIFSSISDHEFSPL
jgi:hypothetical protein